MTTDLSEILHNRTERPARLFACDCVERTIYLWKEDCFGSPTDDISPLEAIAVARRYASGRATNEELRNVRNVVRAIEMCSPISARAAIMIAIDAGTWDIAFEAAWIAAKLLGQYDDAGNILKGTERETANARESEWQAQRLRQYLDGSL